MYSLDLETTIFVTCFRKTYFWGQLLYLEVVRDKEVKSSEPRK